MNDLTKAEFLAKHGDAIFAFVSYYKYSFIFRNKNGSFYNIGDSSDIYKSSIKFEMTVKELFREFGHFEIMLYDDCYSNTSEY